MDDKKKNSPKRNWQKIGLILSIGLNLVFAMMFLIFYLPSSQPLRAYREPDAFQLTATALIQNATMVVETQYAHTQIANGFITAIPTLTPEPIPTLSPNDKENLREQYLQEIETALGFVHPVLEETVDNLIDSITQRIEAKNRAGQEGMPTQDTIIHDMDRLILDSTEYITVILQNEIDNTYGIRAFFFSVNNDDVLLLTELSREFLYGVQLENFDDRNGNGFPDVVVYAVNVYGNSYNVLSFVEVRPNGETIDFIQQLNATIIKFVDFNDDGILELHGFQSLFLPEGVQDDSKFPDIPRWFFWNGEEYEAYPIVEGEE